MLIGYARTSTRDQAAGLDAQRRDLEAAGCEEITIEQVSSVAERPQLEAMMTFVRKGDVVVVTKLDRFARSILDLWSLIQRIEAKGAALRILAFNGGSLDTGSAQGKLQLSILGAVAQFEREIMLERQRDGIAKAKAEGKYKGRERIKSEWVAEVKRHATDGHGKAAITRLMKAAGHPVAERSVYRILNGEWDLEQKRAG
jgi:DNA invertase Pin-like site-specific DNA recombinase